MRQKRIAAIHDISGVGKCSLTVALPIISVAGIECCALPTALLSTHTGGFKNIHIKDLTEDILKIVKHWQQENFEFDAIYSGYLGSFEQVDLVKEAFAKLKNKNTVIVVDPVMGDNGKLYQAFTLDFPKKMKELCEYADVITPNLTEACLMLGEEYRKPPYTKEYLENILEKLSKLCKGTVVLTGAILDEKQQGAALRTKNGETVFVSCDAKEGLYHGTGDIFSSTFVSALVLGKTEQKALEIAVKFTSMAIENTKQNMPELWYGVNFEGVLYKLYELLKED